MAPAKKTEKSGNEIREGQSVTVDGTVFVKGDEDALAEVLTSQQADYLRSQGAITGFEGQPEGSSEIIPASPAKAMRLQAALAQRKGKTGAEAQSKPFLGEVGRGKAAEPLSATLHGVQSTDGDTAAAALGGGGQGAPPTTVGGKADHGVQRQSESGEAPDFDSMTVAELADYLDEKGADQPKGSGASGQVVKADLVKAAKKASK